MLSYLPLYLRKSEIYQGIIQGEEKEFQLLDVELEDIQKQFFIDTATWAIPIYEKELKIIPPQNSTVEERRAMIKAKWRMQSKIDKALLEAVASAILQTPVKVTFDGTIHFQFGLDTPIKNLKAMRTTIDDIKPAHLPFEVEGIINNGFTLKAKHYSFPVSYQICNRFQTETIPGKMAKSNLVVNSKSYVFDVYFPICNTFVTSTINSVESSLNFELTSEYSTTDVLYKRVGQTITGEGEI